NFDCDTNVVEVSIRRLRAKIDDPFETKLIHTLRGVGYVLEKRLPNYIVSRSAN
uniref:winged helix-turn-helix domain-containing protein n=1 Tax=Pseudomonas juntendi TaxID=2666183 RepID=UPI001F384573